MHRSKNIHTVLSVTALFSGERQIPTAVSLVFPEILDTKWIRRKKIVFQI